MSTEGGPAQRVRSSDAEREACAEAVRQAMTEGRLTLDEGEERMVAVYATRFRDELPGLLADLPKPDEPSAQDPAGAGLRRDRRSGAGPAVRDRRMRVVLVVCWFTAISALLSLADLADGHHAFRSVFWVLFVLLVLRRIAYRRWGVEPGSRRRAARSFSEDGTVAGPSH